MSKSSIRLAAVISSFCMLGVMCLLSSDVYIREIPDQVYNGENTNGGVEPLCERESKFECVRMKVMCNVLEKWMNCKP